MARPPSKSWQDLGEDQPRPMPTVECLQKWYAVGVGTATPGRISDVPTYADRMRVCEEYALNVDKFAKEYRPLYERVMGRFDSAGRDRFSLVLLGIENFAMNELRRMEEQSAREAKERLEAAVVGEFESMSPTDPKKIWHYHSRWLVKLGCGHETLKDRVVYAELGKPVVCHACGVASDRDEVLRRAGYEIVRPTLTEKIRDRVRPKKRKKK